MYVTLTNTTGDAEVIGTPDGTWGDVLQSHVAYDLLREEVLAIVIGDMPGLREKLVDAGGIVQQWMQRALEMIGVRKDEVRAAVGKPEDVVVVIANHGPAPVRVRLGEGVHEIDIAPGTTMGCSAVGYLYLRELDLLDTTTRNE